jgi:hypothetical protein
MKKLFALFVSAFATANIYAACTPATTAPPIDGGFFPAANTQPCVVKGTALTDYVIQLKNFGNITNDVFVVSTRIDTVVGLPSGLTWNMTAPAANAANTLLLDEIGCIEISGTTNEPTGTYNLDFAVTVEVSLSGSIQTVSGRTSELVTVFNNQFGTDADFSYFINVVNTQSECTNTVGIRELTQVSSLNVYPNPVTDKTVLTFYNTENAVYTVKVLDAMGKEVYAENINSVLGMNRADLNLNGISSGVYFLVLSNAKATATRRLIVE